MSTLKDLQKILTSKKVLFLVAVLVLSLALSNYSVLKGMVVDTMSRGSYSLPQSGSNLSTTGKLPQDYDDVKKAPVRTASDNVVGATQDMASSSPAHVQGMVGGAVSNVNFSPVGVEDPSSLLPNDVNSEWAKLNPTGSHDLKNVSLLKAGYHIGIDTVGQSLRNANLQLRSEPPNPQFNVGPFNNSTIGPDLVRPLLEIGS
jgi:hypothetical protein